MQVFQSPHFYKAKPFTEQSKRDTTNDIQIHILINSYTCNKRLNFKYVYIQVHVFAHLYMLLLSIWKIKFDIFKILMTYEIKYIKLLS